ncbi:MAG: CofH family radical SAM protein [Alistipes sp.]|nr:CofH family radical SAM protein [Candidatus Alistipes equi]
MVAIDKIFQSILEGRAITKEKALVLYLNAPCGEIAYVADELRKKVKKDSNIVTWQIDRNINTTNVCISSCRFCNFHRKPHETDKHFITPIDEYIKKTEELIKKGGDQILLQGGLHPKLGIQYYESLFRELKAAFPKIKLNALGAPEISHIARISSISTIETLSRLKEAGLDTLPGAGAEILSNRVRKIISPAKPSVEEWIRVMREAHSLGIPSTATMMYGSVESIEERIDHLFILREIHEQKPASSIGFTAFIPWIYLSRGTELERMGYRTKFSATEYLRIIAISRIILYNIPNIQASILTVGIPTAQMALHSGANDLGSILLEEHVVSSAGKTCRVDQAMMESVIRGAGFTPRLRDQLYNYR